jgi:hypothetical protein
MLSVFYKNSKKVRFNKIVCVILIPSNKDYNYFGLRDELWYGENDYKFFLLNYKYEINY